MTRVPRTVAWPWQIFGISNDEVSWHVGHHLKATPPHVALAGGMPTRRRGPVPDGARSGPLDELATSRPSRSKATIGRNSVSERSVQAVADCSQSTQGMTSD